MKSAAPTTAWTVFRGTRNTADAHAPTLTTQPTHTKLSMEPPDLKSQLAQPILLIGSDGMLGRAWAALLRRLNLDYTPTTLHEIDLTRPETIKHIIDGSWPIVINCAAWTDVDGAEANEKAAAAVNADGPGHLARRCQETGALLVHYSTDYVFDGQATIPYAVNSPIKPIGAYGRTKAAGEKQIIQSGCRHLIVRTSWLYAPWGANFVRTMVRLLHEKDQVQVVDDQTGRPTSAEHLALATATLLGHGQTGTVHLTDGGQCTWFEFASEIGRVIGAGCRVEPCTSEQFPRPAPRPSYSVLDLSEAEPTLGPTPDWKSNLADVLGRLESE